MERRRGTPSRSFWFGLVMEEPEQRGYDEEGEGGSLTPLPPAAAHARVALQALPTIAVEEQPRKRTRSPSAGGSRPTSMTKEWRWRQGSIVCSMCRILVNININIHPDIDILHVDIMSGIYLHIIC